MRALRISAISFLNTAPLMWSFDHEPSAELRQNFEISYTVPSACARSLYAGTADIGIIPAITYATIPDLVIIPDIAIAARGPVRSILLISKVPIDRIRTVATDSSSRTSAALTRVLLTKWYGGPRELREMAPDLPSMLAVCDAALIIGDPALTVNTEGYYAYDLAELWHRHTGRSFVFAVWAVRRASLAEADPALDIVGVFQRSRDIGIRPENIQTIAAEWSPRLDLTPESIVSYLTQNIYFRLDQPCLDGLQLFYRYAAECGAIDRAPELRFLDSRTVTR
jgi:chorismate dehydratase